MHKGNEDRFKERPIRMFEKSYKKETKKNNEQTRIADETAFSATENLYLTLLVPNVKYT